MKIVIKYCMAILLIVALISLLMAPAAMAADTDISSIIADTAAYLQETVTAPGIGQTGGEWAVIALVRSGAAIPDGYITSYYDKVSDQLDIVRGLLSTVKYSEYSRVALAISAIGGDPRDVGGYDMLAPLMDYDSTINQGINGPIFALIALAGTGNINEPVAERYISFILDGQLEDGGFTLTGSNADPDTTAMALTALSYFRSRPDVADAVGRATQCLSRLQSPKGGFTSFSSTNSESVSQVIIALCSLGIPVDDARFIKGGNTLLGNLMSYYLKSGCFEHESGGGASLMATEQALCALAALQRSRNGQNTLYDMSDAPKFTPGAPQNGLSGKHPDVSVPGVADILVQFDDISGNDNKTAILALAERGVVTGYSSGQFAPFQTITRAEFTAIIVRALGLPTGGKEIAFSDVPAGSWFFDYVYTASGYGIIQGRSPDTFDPAGLITRQEAAVILQHAAMLCGLNETFDDTAIRNVLSQFTDYRTAAPWASGALAFCYYYGIFDDSGIEIMPASPALRGEVAGMVYRMLVKSKLL